MRTEVGQGSIDAVRSFNRFYTRKIGVLQEHLLSSEYTLPEVRVMFEIAHKKAITASALGKILDIDPGYLSRILKSLQAKRLIAKALSETDRRESMLSLSDSGILQFAELNRRSNEQIEGMLAALDRHDLTRLIDAMDAIQRVLEAEMGREREERKPYVIRSHEPGDIGWIVHRHGILYAREYNWDETFEGLVAEIAGAFLMRHDPKSEHCWIAQRDHELLGSVMLVKGNEQLGKLRLLLVEPKARGLGIGKALVAECIRFARRAGYKKLQLWTNSVLHAARAVYEQAGFRLIDEQPHHSFGHDLIGQTWELELQN